MNAKQIESLEEGVILWDDKVIGLHVRVFRTKRTFYLKYRSRIGFQARPKLGDYGPLTLPAAREIARQRLAQVRDDSVPDPDSPMSFEAQGEVNPTMLDLELKFMRVHAPKRKLGTQQMYELAWARLSQSFKQMLVRDVKRTHILELHYKLRSSPVQANRTLAVLQKAMNLAELWEWRPMHSNPVYMVERYKEKARRRYPTPDEAAAIFGALRRCEHDIFAGFIWLLCLTGCRTGEILTAHRSWVKPSGLHLPDSKTGERIIALSKAAREVIATMPVVKGNPHLIPGRIAGGRLIGVHKLWDRLLIEAFIPEHRRETFLLEYNLRYKKTGKGKFTATASDLQMRDLRRYYASLGLSGGLSLEAVGQLLGHRHTQTTKRYAYLQTDAADRAAEIVGERLGFHRLEA